MPPICKFHSGPPRLDLWEIWTGTIIQSCSIPPKGKGQLESWQPQQKVRVHANATVCTSCPCCSASSITCIICLLSNSSVFAAASLSSHLVLPPLITCLKLWTRTLDNLHTHHIFWAPTWICKRQLPAAKSKGCWSKEAPNHCLSFDALLQRLRR